MSVNENISTIEVLNNNAEYDHLLTIPIRDHNDYFTLEDVFLSNANLIDKDINLLFLIREVILLKPLYKNDLFDNLTNLDWRCRRNSHQKWQITSEIRCDHI